MIGYPSGQDGAILPARDYGLFPAPQETFCEAKTGLPKFSCLVFALKYIFRDSYRFPVVSVSMELQNEKTECVNENENKENRNVGEFHEFILQQKPANTKVKTQSDMKAWKRFCLQENGNRELCDIPQEEPEEVGHAPKCTMGK